MTAPRSNLTENLLMSVPLDWHRARLRTMRGSRRRFSPLTDEIRNAPSIRPQCFCSYQDGCIVISSSTGARQ
jgi:hypothetical protein